MYHPPTEEMASNTAGHFLKTTSITESGGDDAITEWNNFVRYHDSHNGTHSSLEQDKKCKYWFILGYNIAKKRTH